MMTKTGPSSIRRTPIDVVVPVFNKLQLLEQAVGSIAGAVEAYGAARLWLVDNGSTDGSYELLTTRFSGRATLLRLSAGTISAVRNLGAAQGEAPLISFIDCDCLVPGDYFARLNEVATSGSLDATGCKVILPPCPTWVEAVWNRMHDEGPDGPREWINSANFAVRRRIFASVGGFDESLVTGEDAELCQRIWAAGGRIVQNHQLAVAHLDNAKTLAAFFRKERWRGLGMLGTVSWKSIDKPVAMTLMHLLSLVAAVVIMTVASAPLWTRLLISLGLLLATPSVTVVYRRLRSAQKFRLDQAVVLYELYYLARIAAGLLLAARLGRTPR